MNRTFRTLSKEEFQKELENKFLVLIDLRSQQERETYWKIRDNQLNINFYSIDFAKKIMSLNKTKRYLIYCMHWNRSLIAMQYMKENWFSRVCELWWGFVDRVKN